MRICDLTIFYHQQSGGVRTYIHEKICYLARHRNGNDHLVIVPGERDLELRQQHSRIQFLRGPVVPFARPYRVIFRLVKAYRLVLSFQPDVIEVGCPYLFPWVAFLVRWRLRRAAGGQPPAEAVGTPGQGGRPVCRVVGFYHSDFPSAYLRLRNRLLGEIVEILLRQLAFRYIRLVYRRMDLTIAPSPAIAAFLTSYGIERVEIVPLGVDTVKFHPQHRRPWVRNRLGLPGGQFLLLFVGRFSREKGLACLLRSLELLSRQAPGRFHLLFVGAGPLAAELRSWSSTRSDVTVWGYLQGPALSEVYASADIFVSPGTAETFGLTLLEAQASGLPVIAGSSGAAPEVVAPAAGALIDPRDPEAMAAAVSRMAGQDLRALGWEARRFVEEHYSWSSTFDRLLRAYEQLTSQGEADRDGRASSGNNSRKTVPHQAFQAGGPPGGKRDLRRHRAAGQ